MIEPREYTQAELEELWRNPPKPPAKRQTKAGKGIPRDELGRFTRVKKKAA